ncbi:MAG: hypothetical protein WCO98_01095, partial [bacterium]
MAVVATISIVGAIVVPVIAKARDKAKQTACMSNQRQIAMLINMYAQDNKTFLPVSSKIWSGIQKYDVNIERVKCPSDENKNHSNSYVYNNRISGVYLGQVTDPAYMLMTVDGETVTGEKRTLSNTYYSPADVQYRHSSLAVASYADGHVEAVDKITDKETWDK